MAPARRFEIAVTTFQRRYFGSGQHLDIRLRLVHRQMGESGTLPGETLGLQDMEDSFQVTCPYCGETVELFLESDVEGSLVQDCEVCCNPWQVQVWTE